MDVIRYKLRVYLGNRAPVAPCRNLPKEMMGTVLSIEPYNNKTAEDLQNPENIPFIVAGISNYGDWRCGIVVRWDNDARGYLNPCMATLYSTTIRVCESIWTKAKQIRRADKQLHELKAITFTKQQSLFTRNEPKHTKINWTKIPSPGKPKYKSLKMREHAKSYGGSISMDFNQAEAKVIEGIKRVHTEFIDSSTGRVSTSTSTHGNTKWVEVYTLGQEEPEQVEIPVEPARSFWDEPPEF